MPSEGGLQASLLVWPLLEKLALITTKKMQNEIAE
jgi:hypothetical protein